METKTEQEHTEKESRSKSALRRQRERELRLQLLLNAAEFLFAEQGYHQTSIEQIAAKCEYSVGTVYFYFKNKEDMLIQLLEDIGFRLRATIGAAFKKSDATLEGIQQAGYVFFDEFCINYPNKLVIIFRESVGQSKLVEMHRKRILDKLLGDLLGAIHRVKDQLQYSLLSDHTAEVIAVSIMGIYERVAYHYLINGESLLLNEEKQKKISAIGRESVGFIIGGIQNLMRGNSGCI
ncbi:MAG: TetR/AcrR family transcriptional regulator [Desulfobacterales bacterium]|nr:TetR/AcrR family transcriptional regulator [Desulfobacterales bacterium]